MATDRLFVQVIFIAILSKLASCQSCISIAPDPTMTTRVLLDTNNLTNLPWINVVGSNSLFFRDDANCRPLVEVNGVFEVATNLIMKPPGNLSVTITIDYEGSCGGSESSLQCIAELRVLSSSTQRNDEATLRGSPIIQSGVSSGSSVIADLSDMNDGFQLYFTGSSTPSLNITRVRVTYEVCLAATVSLVNYEETIAGRSVSGSCTGNSMAAGGIPLSAVCQSNTMFMSSSSCQCDAGYTLSSDSMQCDSCAMETFKGSPGNGECTPCPGNSNAMSVASTSCTCNERYQRPSTASDSDACSECTANNYLSGGTCMACPTGSISSGGTTSACECGNNLVTMSQERMTTSDNCDRCMSNFFRQASTCTQCPSNSEREFMSDESRCDCVGNAATTTGQIITTSEACTGCVNDFFLNSDQCMACPSNSFSTSATATSCTCDPGTVRPDGGASGGPCSSCAAGHFRDGACQPCPRNSERLSATAPEEICVCKSNYGRQPASINSVQCSPFVGFSNSMETFDEGANTNIEVTLSAPANGTGLEVPFRADPSSYVSSTSVTFPRDSMTESIPVTISDNDIALEDTKMFTITLQSTPDGIVGEDPNFLNSVQVNINDNDNVEVGFTMDTARYNESAKNTNLKITRLQEIANSFTLKLESDKELIRIPSDVTITSARSTETVEFEIINNVAGGMSDRTVTITVSYNGPPQYMDSVLIGGGSTFAVMKIVVVEDDSSVPSSPFPVEGIIGAAVAAAGLAVLLLVIIVLCFCIFRLQANRQGFYPTHEDKTTEAPTMIRYSASLRSISSQTVMGVSEGKSVPRENEFYV